MKPHHQLIKGPIITEKSHLQKAEGNKVTFRVDVKANKREVKKAVEELFKVKVVSVNTMVRKGKSKGMAYRSYMRPDIKRAVVTLREGDAIEFI